MSYPFTRDEQRLEELEEMVPKPHTRIADLEAKVAGLQTLEQHVRARSAEFAVQFVLEVGKRDQRIAELEAHRLNVATAVGIYYGADGHAPEAGPDAEVLGEVERLRRKAAQAEDLETKAMTYECDWYAAKQQFGDARAKLTAKIRELETRIRELTEWRPIETAPYGLSLVAAKEGGWPFVLQRYMDGSWSAPWTDDELIGWLPLPEVKP